MIKEFANESNLYVEFEPLVDVNQELKSLRHAEVLSVALPKNKGVYAFFNELHCETQKYAPKRKERKVIEAMALELMLPMPNMSKEQLQTVVQELHKKYLFDLSYVVYLVKRGRACYLRYICSERTYFEKEVSIPTFYGKDVYQKKNAAGKKVFTHADDEDGACIHTADEIRSLRIGHFSNKSRKFAGNKKEFKQKIKQIRMLLCSIFRKLNFVKKQLFFARVNGKEAKGNVYTYQNIRDLNNTLEYFETILRAHEQNLELGYLMDYYDELVKIRCKFQQRVKKLKFRLHKKVVISLNYCLRRDYFLENLTSFQDEFTREIDKFSEMMENSVLGNFGRNIGGNNGL